MVSIATWLYILFYCKCFVRIKKSSTANQNSLCYFFSIVCTNQSFDAFWIDIKEQNDRDVCQDVT